MPPLVTSPTSKKQKTFETMHKSLLVRLRRVPGYAFIPNVLWQRATPSLKVKVLYALLLCYEQEYGRFPTLDEVAAELGYGPIVTRRYLRLLKREGMVYEVEEEVDK